MLAPVAEQEAGIPIKLAATIGIAVDHRRHNRSLESLQVRLAGGPPLQPAHARMRPGRRQRHTMLAAKHPMPCICELQHTF